MDLLVPCIVEGRSELRNAGRVNCKTHWPILWLRNTLLTERLNRFADSSIVLVRRLQRVQLSVHFKLNISSSRHSE